MQKISTLSFLLSLLVAVAIIAASVTKAQECQAGSCVCDTSSGRIDLSSLVTGADYSFQGNDGKFDYYYSPCGNSVVMGECYGAAVCQVNPENGNSFNTGSVYNEKIVIEGDSISVQYTDGDDGRHSVIKLVCDDSNIATFTALGEPYELEYDFELKTRCACYDKCREDGPTDPRPTDPPGNGGKEGRGTAAGEIGIVLMVLAIVAIVTYFIVGGIILHQKYHRIGADLIPQRNFWLALPGLVKDGFIFTFSPIIRLIKSRIGSGGGEYETLS